MQSTIPYRTLGRTGERVSAIGLGGWHLGLARVDERSVSGSFERRSIVASTSWTTAGITTTARARPAWERRSGTATGRRSFS